MLDMIIKNIAKEIKVFRTICRKFPGELEMRFHNSFEGKCNINEYNKVTRNQLPDRRRPDKET